MGLIDQTQFVERLRFFDGEQLFASDLQEIEQFNREMRWLHNRSLHNFGIGRGMSVTGNPGDISVVIGAGYAIDCFGREIILMSPLTEPILPRAGKNGASIYFALTVAYPDDATLASAVAETRQGLCGPTGVVRLLEQPVFCWVELTKTADCLCPANSVVAEQIKSGQVLCLAYVEIRNCQIRSLDVSCRSSARCASVPHIVCGRATPTWDSDKEKWVVDTCDAGFVKTPCYSFRLVPREKALAFSFGHAFQASLARVKGSWAGSFEITMPAELPLLGKFLSFLNEKTQDVAVLNMKELENYHPSTLVEFDVIWMGVEA